MWTHRRSGQTHYRGSQDHRSPYERDRTRVIHSPSFRRLQGKTQILRPGGGDFHRTRLTHSLEVASIGQSIVRSLSFKGPTSQVGLLPDDDLINVICLLHDIGHPPFGHSGEEALNFMMRDAGGFEGNAHTLRLLTKLETCYGAYGLDLTRRALLGILKYPVKWSDTVALKRPDDALKSAMSSWEPPKAYFDSELEEIDWILQPLCNADRDLLQRFKTSPTLQQHGQAAYYSFDCSVMNTADNIAYGVHDLEDAIHLHLIHRSHVDTHYFEELFKASQLKGTPAQFLDILFDGDLYIRKQAIGEIVNYFIAAVEVGSIESKFENPLLKYNVKLLPEAQALLNYLMECIYTHVIDSQENRTFQYGGQTIVCHLFEAFSRNPSTLLDSKNRALFQHAESDQAANRVICDYIAAMTDGYAHRMHERLFGYGKVFHF